MSKLNCIPNKLQTNIRYRDSDIMSSDRGRRYTGKSNNANNYSGGDGAQRERRHQRSHQGGRGGGKGSEKKGTSDMRELTAALMEAREGTGDVVEILMRSTFRPRLPGLTKMVSRLGKEGYWKKALELFEAAVSIGLCEPDTALTNAAISACDKGGQWQKALEYFDKIEKLGIKRDAITYSATISALGRGKQWEGALQVFDHMRRSGIRADVVTCCSLINALEKSGQWEMAECLFYYMKGTPLPQPGVGDLHQQQQWGTTTPSNSGSALPPYTSPNSVLKSVLRSTSGMPGPHLATVNENRIVADDEFGSLGFVSSPIDANDNGTQISTDTLSQGSDHGSLGYVNGVETPSRRDSLSSVATSAQGLQDVLLDFSHLTTNDTPGENQNLRRSISCFPQVNQETASSERARSIDFSHALGVTPNRVCCNSLMGAFARARPTQWKKAIQFLDSLWSEDEHLHPDVVSYNTALKACSSAFQLKQMEMLFEDMKSRGIQPNMATFQFAIEAALETRSSLFLKTVIDWINEYPRLKSNSAGQLVTACIRCDMCQDGLDVFEEALTNNVQTIAESSETIFGALIRHDDVANVIRVLDLMCEMRSLPSVTVCSSLIDFLCRHDHWQQAANLLEAMTNSESISIDRMVSVSPVNSILKSMVRIIKQSQDPHEKARQLLPYGYKVFRFLGAELPCRPNQESYCHIIRLSETAGEHIQALILYDMMSKQKYLPDQETMNYILSASIETGELSKSIQAASQLILNGVHLSDSVIYKGFEACLQQKEWHLAMTLCDALERVGQTSWSDHNQAISMYTHLLKEASQCGESNIAMKILASLQQRSIQVDPMLAAQIMGTSAMSSHTNFQEKDHTSCGSLFYTDISDSQPEIVEFRDLGSLSTGMEKPVGTLQQDVPPSNIQTPVKKKILQNLITSWSNQNIPPEAATIIQNIQSALANTSGTPVDQLLLKMMMAVAPANPALAIDICCTLHAVDILQFFKVPQMYSRSNSVHGWDSNIDLGDMEPNMGMIVIASWLSKAHEAMSWELDPPQFDQFCIQFSTQSIEKYEQMSLGIFKLLTTGHAVIFGEKTFPCFTDTSAVTLFQKDELHGGIEIHSTALHHLG